MARRGATRRPATLLAPSTCRSAAECVMGDAPLARNADGDPASTAECLAVVSLKFGAEEHSRQAALRRLRSQFKDLS